MSTRLRRELRSLDMSQINSTNLMDHGLATGLITGPNLPKNFSEAWNHKDPIKRTLWRNSILKELQDMNKRKVFLLLLISHVPIERVLIGNKWVLVIKRDGRHRSWMVVLGYTQIPRVDFLENFAPVVHDMIFRLILVLAIIFGFSIKVINVEVAFLHGDLLEDIFMLLPAGFHLLKENQQALLDLGYIGPLDQAKDHV